MGDTIFMKKLTVSVVIPVYNSENTIVEVLNSVRKQSAINSILEIIIVNDGSFDRSAELISSYCIKNPDMPIRYFYQENRGVSAARNKGILEASGELIALLDSDDIWHSDKLEKQLKAFDENPQIVFLGTGHLDKPFIRKGHVIRELYKADLIDILWSFFPVTPSVVFRKYAIEKVGLFDENQRYCEDINYYLKFAVCYNYYYLPEKLVDIDIGKEYHGEKGLTSNLQGMHYGEMKNLKELYQSKNISAVMYVFFTMFFNMKYVRRLIKHRLKRRKY